ncbi:MAG: prealbumin-like fold domain-containing protein, partial [Eubacteriales bacterium]|nr:prealbumin-like fold domain-containing protein [Eubacteriales bacterium]
KDGKITGWADVTTADGKTTYPAGSTLTSGADGKFAIAGLDAGSYYLVETKAPAGYNLLKDAIGIEIQAELDKGENSPALKTLKIKIGDTTKDGNLDTGAVATDVKNNQGATLPETGGAGTTAFYIIGGCLVLAAAVLLVTKKRMGSKG